jgi:hypothetical protein
MAEKGEGRRGSVPRAALVANFVYCVLLTSLYDDLVVS